MPGYGAQEFAHLSLGLFVLGWEGLGRKCSRWTQQYSNCGDLPHVSLRVIERTLSQSRFVKQLSPLLRQMIEPVAHQILVDRLRITLNGGVGDRAASLALPVARKVDGVQAPAAGTLGEIVRQAHG